MQCKKYSLAVIMQAGEWPKCKGLYNFKIVILCNHKNHTNKLWLKIPHTPCMKNRSVNKDALVFLRNILHAVDNNVICKKECIK